MVNTQNVNLQDFKEMTVAVREFLIKAAQEEIKDNKPAVMISCISQGYDKKYSYLIVEVMREAGLVFRNPNDIFFKLTNLGRSLAQDITDDDVWEKATAFCEEKQLYSFRSVVSKSLDLVGNSIQENVG